MNKSLILSVMLSLFSLTSFANSESSFVLKNLERERAALLNVLLTDDFSLAERQVKMQSLYRRLVSAEQIALRYEHQNGEVSRLAQQIFTQYDFSFLFHASTEKNRSVIAHWLNQLELSDQNIEQGWAGER